MNNDYAGIKKIRNVFIVLWTVIFGRREIQWKKKIEKKKRDFNENKFVPLVFGSKRLLNK